MNGSLKGKSYSADTIKKICLDAGADDVGLVDLDRKSVKKEKEGILYVYPLTRSIIATINRQEIDFLCNCCGCHCMILKTALAQPKPGLILNSGFKPRHDRDLCTSCGTCIDRCPTQALTMDNEDKPELNSDRCIGCGACATGCAFDAVTLVERAGISAPPMDQKALREAIRASQG